MSFSSDPEALRLRLWEAMQQSRVAMLAADPPNHMQPMTLFAEPKEAKAYFFSRNDTDLVRSIGAGAQGHLVIMTKDDALQACVRGGLRLTHDRERIDRYWNPVVAAWYPDGKDDPRLTVVEFSVEQADVWVSETGSAKFALEIAKANLTGREPDVGASGLVEER